MSASTKSRQEGMTLIEVLIVVTLIGLLIGPIIGGMFYFYGGVVANNQRADLALEAQTILRIISGELRVSAGVREQTTIEDPSKSGGWQTSNDNLVMIMATPALDSNNEFIINSDSGEPYQNELVYHARGGTLYKRTLAHPEAMDNTATTSCLPDETTSSCPPDKILTDNFKGMSFTFYDLNDQVLDEATDNLVEARSINMIITTEDRVFGRTVTFKNDMRVTLRNTFL